jgi:raffinose/stachyose/melibiose transport system permease protein
MNPGILEAARIDGASGFSLVRRILIPLSVPAITVCFFLVLAWCFKSFDIVISLTHGGRFRSTQTVALNIYEEAFRYNNYGLGTAKSLLYFVIVGCITVAQVAFTRRMEVEA